MRSKFARRIVAVVLTAGLAVGFSAIGSGPASADTSWGHGISSSDTSWGH